MTTKATRNTAAAKRLREVKAFIERAKRMKQSERERVVSRWSQNDQKVL